MTGASLPPVVRKADQADGPTILRLIDALADYEHLVPPDAAAKERLLRDMFGERRRLDAYLCEIGGRAAGYALVLETYSSFLALPTLYLEDIFVLSEFRNQGAGKALFRAMAREAHRRGCGRMEWTVLDWNNLAIEFYQRQGSHHMKEWQLYRLTREELLAFVEQP